MDNDYMEDYLRILGAITDLSTDQVLIVLPQTLEGYLSKGIQ